MFVTGWISTRAFSSSCHLTTPGFHPERLIFSASSHVLPVWLSFRLSGFLPPPLTRFQRIPGTTGSKLIPDSNPGLWSVALLSKFILIHPKSEFFSLCQRRQRRKPKCYPSVSLRLIRISYHKFVHLRVTAYYNFTSNQY